MDCFGVVIKIQQLLSRDGKRTNGIFDEIQSARGIHNYLGYDGIVILSSIMPDRMIDGFSVDAYAKMIAVLRPDFYLTPDGETYLGEPETSAFEIGRIVRDTDFLIEACPYSQPIGLIKGCTVQQIDSHTLQLLARGFTHFVFHTGDFLCRGTACDTNTAIVFASTIRKRVPWLGVYGIGAMKSLKSFSFADAYITQSHFGDPFRGRFRDRERMNNGNREISRTDIMNELSIISRDIAAIELQSTLSRWLSSDVSEQRVEQGRLFSNPINGETLREGM